MLELPKSIQHFLISVFVCSLLLFRLRPEELNTAVLNYMTESLGYGLSDIIHTVISNKPSTIMACYHLLLKKLTRHQKVVRTMKVK